jgi:hypothetical protein
MTVRIGAISADESEIAPRALAEDGSEAGEPHRERDLSTVFFIDLSKPSAHLPRDPLDFPNELLKKRSHLNLFRPSYVPTTIAARGGCRSSERPVRARPLGLTVGGRLDRTCGERPRASRIRTGPKVRPTKQTH